MWSFFKTAEFKNDEDQASFQADPSLHPRRSEFDSLSPQHGLKL
jgi:hypothetical protein